MLKRKLQITAKGTFVITVPMHIVLALGLQRGMDLEIKLEKSKIVLIPVTTVTRQDVVGTGIPTTTVFKGRIGDGN